MGDKLMAFNHGNEMHEIEVKIEHTTEKAWLVVDNMSGNQAWLAKKIATMVRAADEDGNVLFHAPEWWMKQNKFI